MIRKVIRGVIYMANGPIRAVIQGGREKMTAWLDFPRTVIARSPQGGGACLLRVSRRDAEKAAMRGRRQPVFDFWAVIMGEPPPVNAVRAVLPLCRIDQAHACFQGIQRPLAEDDIGENVVSYILKPRNFYRFEASQAMACVATPFEVPADLVFVAYARLDVPYEPTIGGIVGTLTHWSFVESDPADAMLPVDWNTRYKRRLW